MAKAKPTSPATHPPVTRNASAQASALYARSALFELLSNGRKRDLNEECQYPNVISAALYREMYDRNGISARVVEVLPEETWAEAPEVYEDETEDSSTPFEEAFEELVERCSFWHYLERADVVSGIGSYGLLVLKFDDGLPYSEPVGQVDPKTGRFMPPGPFPPPESEDQPVKEDELKEGSVFSTILDPNYKPKGLQLLGMDVFSEESCPIVEWDLDPSSPRFRQPVLYSIRFMDPLVTPVGQTTMGSELVNVHWTRCIHVADNRRFGDIFGTPRQQRVFNYCLDVRKIGGGSAEMFWKGAFPGYSFEVNPELQNDADIDPEALRVEFQRYSEGLQRYLALTGVSAKSLAVQVADPQNHLTSQLKLIATTLGVPWRVLVGSEAAQLASSQDAKTWNKRIARRQKYTITPLLIRPTIERLIGVGVLPVPRKVCIEWPDLNTPDDNGKADVSLKLTQALAAYVGGNVQTIIPPMEYMTLVLGMPRETAAACLESAMGQLDTMDAEESLPAEEESPPAEEENVGVEE